MSPEFKIESDIPLIDPSEELDKLIINTDDEEDDEDPETPGKRGRKPRCRRNDLHVWRAVGDHEKCDLCGEMFPCMNEAKCLHFDCWEARGKLNLHPWILSGFLVPVETGETHGEQSESHINTGIDREDQG